MTYNYRKGAVVTLVREDGLGPGESLTYPASDGWKVEVQVEGCVEITNYGSTTPEPARVLPWHRIWEIVSLS